MKKMILTVVALLATVLASPLIFAAGDAAAGQAKTAMCAGCHGADGNSAMASFPKLAGQGEKYLTKQLQDIKAGDRSIPEMTGMLDNLSEQDLQDMAAYYASKTIQMAGAKEAGLDLGERLYRGGNIETGVPACTGCHSPAGNGNNPAGYPALGGQFAEYIAKQLRAFRTGAHDPGNSSARTNDGDSQIMRGVAAQMNDVEIEAVANFIAGLK
ncbi:c-type cytochrome [Porticoccus sp.]|uniref:c-type cytochrome n=1 Tax=Porticoccus sp. TaxID=2024853 RepID=UPI003F69C9F6